MVVNTGYEQAQVDAFAALVNDGTYSKDFEHAATSREFFGSVMSMNIADLVKGSGDLDRGALRILDCGCGNGAWLDFLTLLIGSSKVTSCYGFDLTPEMVTVAVARLADKKVTSLLHTGNILEAGAYKFIDGTTSFDLIYTYDVIQQLPRKLQFQACETIVDHLKDQGVAVIFDNDCRSKFGRKMARRKFATRYLGMSLVPRYYCNATYPPLEEFAQKLGNRPGLDVKVKISPGGAKRAVIIRKH